MKTLGCLLLTGCFAVHLLCPESALGEDKKKKKKKSDPEERQAPTATRNEGVRSQPGNVPVQMALANLTGGPVELVWVDLNGRQQSYGQLPSLQPGERPRAIQTYAGHVWLFKSGGRVLQTYAATAARQQQITLGGDRRVALVNSVVVEAPRPAPIRDVPAPAPPVGDRVPAAAVEFLQLHNDARAKVAVPALRWSDTLARYAQQWADQLAASGSFQHRDHSKTGYGENMFGGSEGFSAGDAARQWLKEKAVYRGGPVTPENFNSVGHYTQMVWSASTEVGYGIATGPNGVIVVANYNPRGNRNGQKPY